jgi:hypothetical protein
MSSIRTGCVAYLQHSGSSNCTNTLHDDVEDSLQDADVPRDKEPTSHGRVDVTPAHVPHCLQQYMTLHSLTVSAIVQSQIY